MNDDLVVNLIYLIKLKLAIYICCQSITGVIAPNITWLVS